MKLILCIVSWALINTYIKFTILLFFYALVCIIRQGKCFSRHWIIKQSLIQQIPAKSPMCAFIWHWTNRSLLKTTLYFQIVAILTMGLALSVQLFHQWSPQITWGIQCSSCIPEEVQLGYRGTEKILKIKNMTCNFWYNYSLQCW